MNKYEDKDKICPICKGLIYRKGLLGKRPFQCVRCKRWFSSTELDKFWLEDFKNEEV